MIKDAQEYGSLNVHMRSKRADLLTAGTYNLLASATDFDNLRQMLNNTLYQDIIGTEMDKEYPDVIEIDRRLTQHFIDQYNLYKKFIPKRAKGFIDVHSQMYFLNNIKMILSALHGAFNYDEAWGMLISLSDEENAETEELYKAQNVEDMIGRIRDEELRNELSAVVGDYRYLNLVYPLIIAIDQHFYSKLCKQMSNLSGDDKNKTRSLFGARIGIQNIEIILRSKTFDISPTIVPNWLIATKFCPLRTELRDKLIATSELEEAFNIIKEQTPFRDLAIRLLDNIEKDKPPLDNFDRIADQYIVHKANSLFKGASFNVSIFPAFFFLKEIELRNLRAIILGKIHKRSMNETLDKIVLV
ncbi:MAG: V-type ATPase subunit [Asgard group archaeon]|nr:V-type ATPase subunit [Asgard group archaeon]